MIKHREMRSRVGASLLANGRDAVLSHQRCVAIQINNPA